jgi:hypothetical protein
MQASTALEQTQRPEKRFATSRARMALLGGTLHRIEDDRGAEVFILTKWALTRELQSIDDVEAWLDRAEGRRA